MKLNQLTTCVSTHFSYLAKSLGKEELKIHRYIDKTFIKSGRCKCRQRRKLILVAAHKALLKQDLSIFTLAIVALYSQYSDLKRDQTVASATDMQHDG